MSDQQTKTKIGESSSQTASLLMQLHLLTRGITKGNEVVMPFLLSNK